MSPLSAVLVAVTPPTVAGDGKGGGGATPVESALDREALARLRELDPTGQGGVLARVLATYTQSLARLLEQLRTARAAADNTALRHVAHTLKSSSASVGALELSSLCADVERTVYEGRADGLPAKLDALAIEGMRVLAALQGAASQRP
jgi:HPt (histidine-containing phosphotransfer) domain-containing protein